MTYLKMWCVQQTELAKLYSIYITVNYSGQQLPIKRTRNFLKALQSNAFKKFLVSGLSNTVFPVSK
ncbi:hypothetical protein B9G53_20695 [Pseudanabaena sp. SR411]|nr:hypothetical protein B9G53_20695 [Pseudanabaena sp. SR411]